MIEPMKAVLSDQPFSDPDWIFERKLDGIRAIAIKDGSGVSLMSRTARRMNDQFPEVVRALEEEPADDFIVDGEFVAFEDGITSFARLQQRARERVPVFLYVFDLPRHEGEDLRPLPLRERKARLRARARASRPDPLQPAPQRRARRGALPRGLPEGPRGRDRQARRQPLRRRPLARLAEAQVPRRAGARDRRLHRAEGLAHRVRRAAGGLLRETAPCATPGKVGTGFDQHTLRALGAQLRALEQDESPFEPFKPIPPGTRWVRPELVAQIGFAEWTRDGRLRHPRYLGLRDDKPAREVVREVPS